MNIEELLKRATEKKASDLHLIVGLSPVLRIDGDLTFIEKEKQITKKDMEQIAKGKVFKRTRIGYRVRGGWF